MGRQCDPVRVIAVCFSIAVAAISLSAPPATARPGLGYGDLIDSYCIERGRLRVRAHQGHCAMCHHLGTFDVAPEHRVEPNWTEYERGRATGSFEFFCPGSPAATAVADAGAPGTPPATSPQGAARDLGPMGMPPAVRAAGQQAPPADAQAAPADRVAAPTAAPQSAGPEATVGDLMQRLALLHDAAGISLPQEGAWREFADALAAAARAAERLPSAGGPAARIKDRERRMSERIAAIRAVGTALSRLGAVLDEKQRRMIDDGLAPLLEAL